MTVCNFGPHSMVKKYRGTVCENCLRNFIWFNNKRNSLNSDNKNVSINSAVLFQRGLMQKKQFFHILEVLDYKYLI